MPDGFVRHFLRFQIDPVALGGFERVFKFAARAENRLSGGNVVRFTGNQHARFLRRASFGQNQTQHLRRIALSALARADAVADIFAVIQQIRIQSPAKIHDSDHSIILFARGKVHDARNMIASVFLHRPRIEPHPFGKRGDVLQSGAAVQRIAAPSISNVCYCTIKAFALQLFCRGIHAFEKLDFSEQALNLAEAKAT